MKSAIEPTIEVRFTVPIAGVSEEHRLEAERCARETFVMTLLRYGDISAGRAARILGLNRTQLSEVMFEHKISPFDDTMTQAELEQEAAGVVRSLEQTR